MSGIGIQEEEWYFLGGGNGEWSQAWKVETIRVLLMCEEVIS